MIRSTVMYIKSFSMAMEPSGRNQERDNRRYVCAWFGNQADASKDRNHDQASHAAFSLSIDINWIQHA
jgi:hypothetical protein